MSKAEILAELPRLQPAELAEVQAMLDELLGDAWLEDAQLSESDKVTLDAALAEYHNSPNAGSSWEQVRARIEAKLQ